MEGAMPRMAMISVETDESRSVPVPARVVGVDPGLNVTGYAVVEPSARGPYVLEAGVIRPRCPAAEHWASGWRGSTRASSRCSNNTIPARSHSSSFTATCVIPEQPS